MQAVSRNRPVDLEQAKIASDMEAHVATQYLVRLNASMKMLCVLWRCDSETYFMTSV